MNNASITYTKFNGKLESGKLVFTPYGIKNDANENIGWDSIATAKTQPVLNTFMKNTFERHFVG